MLAFRLWSRFGAFRDPMTITQNLTLSIPPKTTIGGMLAAILGIDYNEYFNDSDYFSFEYSVCVNSALRKKSFAQNYVIDYTKESEKRFSAIESAFKADEKLTQKRHILDSMGAPDVLSDKEAEKLARTQAQLDKASSEFTAKTQKMDQELAKKMMKPKPIFRELLIKPEYLIFIKDYKYEEQLRNAMSRHEAAFALYMGNSEFPANYDLLPLLGEEETTLDCLDSFCASPTSVQFEAGKKYTNQYSATRTLTGRRYEDYKNIILCDRQLQLKTSVNGFKLKTKEGQFNCEFI